MIRYKLVDRVPVPCKNVMEWALWFETADRRVARSVIGPLTVSTVFIGAHRDELFETMIFGGDPLYLHLESYCKRYDTWDEAERGHADAVVIAEDQLLEAVKLLHRRE